MIAAVIAWIVVVILALVSLWMLVAGPKILQESWQEGWWGLFWYGLFVWLFALFSLASSVFLATLLVVAR